MKRNLFIILITLIFVLLGNSSNLLAADVTPIEIETKGTPSETFLNSNRRSIGASTDIHSISAPTRGLTRAGDAAGWGQFNPIGDGWEISETGNVGYPVGDVSFPILLSMLLLYFIYRGVSSTKRKSSF